MENNGTRGRYADVRSKKLGRRSPSRSPKYGGGSSKRNSSRSRADKFRGYRSRSRSRSPRLKRDRDSKKYSDEKRGRYSPPFKANKHGRKRSPSPPSRKKVRKRTPSAPRSPSPPASPSPPRSPSPENNSFEAPASPSIGTRSRSRSSSGSGRRRRPSSRKKQRNDRSRRRRGYHHNDDFPHFDEDDMNGSGFEDEKYPDIGEIYEAVVAAIKPFGFFCLLMGLRHKLYGLVHISEMKRDGYVTNVEEVVHMGQTVYVKVISNQPKIALSLKDVDQQTGEDLDIKRTQKLMEDPDFLDKEKNVRQNRGNGLVVSGLQFSNEDEYRDLIANLLINEMNLPALPEHIGYCQPVQGIEFRKKGATTQLVKIRFYEDESVPYNRDDALSRYMTLRNTNLWRFKEIVLNPELRTIGPPRPKIRESLLNPSDFLPPPPPEDIPEDEAVRYAEESHALDRMPQYGDEGMGETGGFMPLPQFGAKRNAEEDDDDDLKLPKRPLPNTSSKPFTQDMVSQITNRVRANLGNFLKTSRFELPRTFTSMPPPPPVSTAPPIASSIVASPSPPPGGSKQPVFHSAPPPPVNLPSSFNANVPPPKMTINISGVPQRISTTATLQQQISTSSELKTSTPNTVQYPSLPQYGVGQQQQQQQAPSQLPPFQTGAVPSHLAALQQQLQQTRFSAPPPIIHPTGGSSSAAPGSATGAQFPYNIPPLLTGGGGSQQTPTRPSLGPYTNSAQAQQHLQQLLALAASGRDPANLFSARTESVSNIPPLFGQQSQQQQPQPQMVPPPHGLQQGQTSRWEQNPYAPAMPSLMGMSSPSSSSSALQPKASSSGSNRSKEKEKTEKSEKGGEAGSGPAPAEITQLLSLAKKLGFNIKTTTADSSSN